ncbi:class IV adenylate cyclase [Photobacterium sanctipauli]|uniref:Class IV adenylate cyclase n=1 Tax=Photobacterium sanctipauli TaxID=1342794 RepID=A0A2T3NVE1_9GAMM|nr:class IV adenylate cyclase [Photobacterium sanctipauli]PSW20222.1 class IV adenylate cyclase [Photobacterium sanctipauli]
MSTDHFNGKYEVELKYRIQSKTNFLSLLARMPHEIMFEDNMEQDWFFDTPDQHLKSQGKSLSIRELEPSGIKLWIVKGPEPDRCEATNITDSSSAKSMLETMGYQVTLTAKKVRSIYFIDEYHITVDFLEGIGRFAEFAIMTDDESKLLACRKELECLAEKFGLGEGDLEFRSYRQMREEKTDCLL